MNPYTNPLDEVKLFFRRKSVLSTLILVNAGVWALSMVLAVFFYLINNPGSVTADNWMLGILALPASTAVLSLKPWSLLTYMFLHLDFFHILFNMLWLYWFGKIFLEYMNSRQLLVTYILGGIAGGALYILAFNVFRYFIPSLEKVKRLAHQLL